MRGEQDGGKISQAYQDHRPYLVDLAFRMLGDIGAAEDIVQDAFTRLMATKLGEIEDKRGWLIVVTSRLCLDQIKSARSRRERAHDASEIEFVAPPPSGLADPADRVTFDDGVRLALLVVLQQLSPAERVVFVLLERGNLGAQPINALLQLCALCFKGLDNVGDPRHSHAPSRRKGA